MRWLKEHIVVGLEDACEFLDNPWGDFYPDWGCLHFRFLVRWSWQLDERWGTGMWKPPVPDEG